MVYRTIILEGVVNRIAKKPLMKNIKREGK